MVKFGERTYRIPAGAVIKPLQQAGYEDVIGVSRVFHPAGIGNLLTLVVVVAAILVAVTFLTWVFIRTETRPKRRRGAGSNSGAEDFPQPEFNALLLTSVKFSICCPI